MPTAAMVVGIFIHLIKTSINDMIEGSIGLGDILRGTNCITTEFGKVESMHQSTGSRKGMLYKIGVHYFFADELEHDWWRELKELVCEKYLGGEYRYKDPVKLQYKGKAYKAIRVFFTDNYRVVIEHSTGYIVEVPVYDLRDRTLEKLVNQFKKEHIC
jgi:hypothetical protein